MILFLCPFDNISETKPQNNGSQRQGKPGSTAAVSSTATPSAAVNASPTGCIPHIQEGPYIGECKDFGTNQDCSGDWLKPVQICIPDRWDSPERNPYGNKKLNIRNRCSTLEANERKSEYIQQISMQWHSGDESKNAQLPIRPSRSEATHPRPSASIRISSTPSAFYDSDPELPVVQPRYKRHRPPKLDLDLDSDSTFNDVDDSELDKYECPRVPRHSTEELESFFESPRSVVDAPNLDNDEEVREFIRVSFEALYLWSLKAVL